MKGIATAIFLISFSVVQQVNASNSLISKWYCDSTDDPVDALPWLSDLIEEIDNNDCFQDIAAYCYRGQVYFTPLTHPTIRCSDAIQYTYNVHGSIRFERGGLLGTDTYPSDFGNATLITTITTSHSSGSGSHQTSTLTVSCPSNITVDCNQNTNICWDLPTATTTCSSCPSNEISGYIYMGEWNGSKYYCSKDIATWENAQKACAQLGGHLAVITSAAENNHLANFLQTQSAFIGGHDRDRDGHYEWINGESFGYQNWYPGQPNNYRNDQYYLELLPNGKWNDEYPSRKNEYICEIPCSGGSNSATITGPSTCGSFSVGTTPIKYTITDDCGNTETCQFTVTVESSMDIHCPSDISIQLSHGQNAYHADWNDPTYNSCCDATCTDHGGQAISGFIYMGKYGDSHYYCSREAASWTSARSICASNGGQLAKVTSSGENHFLANQLQTQTAWIGLTDKDSEGNFVWTDGEPLGTYQPWYPGQPNNYNGRQHYVELLNNGQWNDQYHYALEFIMEIPATSCDPLEQIAGPAKGSSLSPGNYTVTYKATDACGNHATCSFDITVHAAAAADYCASGGHSANSVWIQKVQFADLWSQTGNNGGYKYFSSPCASVTAGQYCDLTLMPGFKSSIYTCYWKVFIDYNEDGDFTDQGEYVAKGSSYKALNGTIRIPPNTTNGKKRMRCVMKVGGYPEGPCGSFSYGETEDYCINVSGGWLQDDQVAESRSRILDDVVTLNSPNQITNTQAKVYPNPTTGLINIVSERGQDIESIEVIDQAGRKIRTLRNPTNESNQIDLTEQVSGLYFVRTVFSNGELSVSKITLVK